MGDDELNFTEDEAASWAHDPRNQSQDQGGVVRAVVVCCLILMGLITWLASSGSSTPQSDDRLGTATQPAY